MIWRLPLFCWENGGGKMSGYAIEMLGITKKFPGIIANDNITLQLKKGEIHALLGKTGQENLLL